MSGATWEYSPIPHYDLVIGEFIEAEIEYLQEYEDHWLFGPWRLTVGDELDGKYKTLDEAKSAGLNAVKNRRGLHIVKKPTRSDYAAVPK